MRFSLFTLILLVVALGTGMAVWFLRGPWNVGETLTVNPYPRDHYLISPDGSRIALWSDNDLWIARRFDAHYLDEKGLVYKRNVDGQGYLCGTILLDHQFDAIVDRAGFVDDNTVVVGLKDSDNEVPKRYCVIRRRFPESTYGHFFRPEVWLFLIAAGFCLVSALVDFNDHRRKKRAAAPSPPPL